MNNFCYKSIKPANYSSTVKYPNIGYLLAFMIKFITKIIYGNRQISLECIKITAMFYIPLCFIPSIYIVLTKNILFNLNLITGAVTFTFL